MKKGNVRKKGSKRSMSKGLEKPIGEIEGCSLVDKVISGSSFRKKGRDGIKSKTYNPSTSILKVDCRKGQIGQELYVTIPQANLSEFYELISDLNARYF